MANMIMASSKTLISSSSLPSSTPPLKLPPISAPLKTLTKLKSLPLNLSIQFNKSTASIAAAAAAAAILAIAPPAPVMAAEIEKAALFDFNLTLPAIVAEFLILMVALDKIYYAPLGKFMDERDASIKEKLSGVKDTTAEVKQLEDQAAAIMKAARAEISAALNKMKKETTEEMEAQLAEGRKKVEAELAEALVKLEAQKDETIKALDSQISALSEDIVKKVLPI